MSKRRYTPTYPAELRERGVRLFRDHRGEYASDNAAYRAIAPKLGCSPDSLRVSGASAPNATLENDLVRRQLRKIASRNWSVKFASCARLMRS